MSIACSKVYFNVAPDGLWDSGFKVTQALLTEECPVENLDAIIAMVKRFGGKFPLEQFQITGYRLIPVK